MRKYPGGFGGNTSGLQEAMSINNEKAAMYRCIGVKGKGELGIRDWELVLKGIRNLGMGILDCKEFFHAEVAKEKHKEIAKLIFLMFSLNMVYK